MSSPASSRQPKAASQPPTQPDPTSPWTEVFQQAQAAMRAERERARQSARQAAAESDAARATQDALSVVFKQD